MTEVINNLQTWWKEILSIAIFTPFMVRFIVSQNKTTKNLIDQNQKFIDNLMTNFNSMKDNLEEFTNCNTEIKWMIKELNENIDKPKLNASQSIRLLKTEMWFVTRSKLNLIKNILLNNHIPWRELYIHEKIKTWLMWLSWEYMGNFESYITPIWKLSIWLDNNFSQEQFDLFIKEIIDIVCRKEDWNRFDIINNKMGEISLLMETLQENLANKLKIEMYKRNLK